jgi:hypothetical protein
MTNALFQHERRWVVVGWKPCNRMLTLKGKRDPAQWRDSLGADVEDADAGHVKDSSWKAVVDNKTDSEGWTYGFDFDRLDIPRDGGRSAMGSTDCVRRRCWVKRSTVTPEG